MYCSHCGAQIDDQATVCPYCGTPTANQKQDSFIQQPQQQPYSQQQPAASGDAPSGGFAFLCFLFPIIGLILYLVWKDQYPLRAKSCGKGAIIGVCVSVGVSILYGIIIVAVVGTSLTYSLALPAAVALL